MDGENIRYWIDNDIYQGAYFGMVVSDTMCSIHELQSPSTFDPIKDMVGGDPFDLEPGQWTDETSMARRI
jgi:ADP-ribosyl-[dinitrogen reductase] hydrolase